MATIKKNVNKGPVIVPTLTKIKVGVGTIGHVDNGKTTLTSAITKFCAEGMLEGTRAIFRSYGDIHVGSTEEKKEKNIKTIKVAHVWYETKKRLYQHQDCPGHEDYIKNMIIGASQMDYALLVLNYQSGEEVIMPQSREHIILASKIGIKKIIVFINKCKIYEIDEKSPDYELEKEEYDLIIEDFKEKIKNFLNKYGYDSDTTPIIEGSALQALNGDKKAVDQIKKLVETMDTYFEDPIRKEDEAFLMKIEGKHKIEGSGTIVTGLILKGKVKNKMTVDLVCSEDHRNKKKLTIKKIESYKTDVGNNEFARAGDNIGISFVGGIEYDDVRRGDVLIEPGTAKARNEFRAEVYFSKVEEGGRSTPVVVGFKPQFYFGVVNLTGEIVSFKNHSLGTWIEERVSRKTKENEKVKTEQKKNYFINPGDNVEITVKFENKKKTLLDKNEQFTVRESGKTIAYGKITELL